VPGGLLPAVSSQDVFAHYDKGDTYPEMVHICCKLQVAC
jgi:hypothetical protein